MSNSEERVAITPSVFPGRDGWENRFVEIESETQEFTSQTRQDLAERINTLASVMDDIVRERRADRQEERQRREENNQRFNNLLEEAPADQQRFDKIVAVNTAEHGSFTQRFPLMAPEISRLCFKALRKP